jgi:hypothetical protein
MNFRYLDGSNIRVVRERDVVRSLVATLTPSLSWKLSEHTKHDIARRYKAGERVCVIAADYGINPWVVCYHAHKRGVPMRRPRRRPRR